MSDAARQKKHRIVVCRGPECGEHRNSAAVHACFVNEIQARRLEGRIELAWQSCFGRCRQGPNVLVAAIEPKATTFLFAIAPTRGDAAMYNGVTPDDVPRILTEHVLAGRPVRDLIKKPDYSTAGAGETLRSQRAVEPEARGKVEPQARAQVEPQARAEVEPEARGKVEPQARAQVEPEARGKVEPDEGKGGGEGR